MREHTLTSNMQKYFKYNEKHNLLKKVLANNFYSEPIVIEYAIIECHLESASRHGGKLR